MTFIELAVPRPVASPRRTERVRLPVDKATLLEQELSNPNQAFFSTLSRRCSSSDLGKPHFSQLSAFLWFSLRTIKRRLYGSGQYWQHRLTPSAGGIHPIEVYITNAPDHETKLLRYDSFGHIILNCIPPSRDLITSLNVHANGVKNEPEAIILWLVGQPDLVTAVYDHAESLIWRDAGALLMTFYVVAAALNLRGCALGITGEPIVSQQIHPQMRGFGAFCLGL